MQNEKVRKKTPLINPKIGQKGGVFQVNTCDCLKIVVQNDDFQNHPIMGKLKKKQDFTIDNRHGLKKRTKSFLKKKTVGVFRSSYITIYLGAILTSTRHYERSGRGRMQ